MIEKLLLILSLPILASAYTLDTGHALYANMKGIYVFDNRTDDGDNIAGTGTMVGTVEDADGFDTPITQSFQSWHNDFDDGYTFCIWHDGMTLDAWESVISISDSTLSWQRYSSNSYFKNYHSGTGATLPDLLTSEVASSMMLSVGWYASGDTMKAYDDSTEIASAAMDTSPKSDSTTSTITLGGQCTITRFYAFDVLLTTTQLGALASDPDSIFTSESGPSGAQIFAEKGAPPCTRAH